jgi:hypothetical protein
MRPPFIITEPQCFVLRFFSFYQRLILSVALLSLLGAADTLGQAAVKYQDLSTDSLIRILQRGADDRVRLEANNDFNRRISEQLLADSTSFSCDGMPKNVSCVVAEGMRIVTWTVPSYGGDKYWYFGFLQYLEPSSGRCLLLPLTDSTETVKKPESEKLSAGKWYGAAYYEIVIRKKRKTRYYTLIGWKGKDRRVTQKVLEVLYFDKSGPRFGAPIFKKEKVYRSRIVFSFTSQATMSLRYEPSKRMIVYDHLSGPKTTGGGTSDPSLMGPDGSYDGYRFRSGRWQWYGDLNMRSGKTNNR